MQLYTISHFCAIFMTLDVILRKLQVYYRIHILKFLFCTKKYSYIPHWRLKVLYSWKAYIAIVHNFPFLHHFHDFGRHFEQIQVLLEYQNPEILNLHQNIPRHTSFKTKSIIFVTSLCCNCAPFPVFAPLSWLWTPFWANSRSLRVSKP